MSTHKAKAYICDHIGMCVETTAIGHLCTPKSGEVIHPFFCLSSDLVSTSMSHISPSALRADCSITCMVEFIEP